MADERDAQENPTHLAHLAICFQCHHLSYLGGGRCCNTACTLGRRGRAAVLEALLDRAVRVAMADETVVAHPDVDAALAILEVQIAQAWERLYPGRWHAPPWPLRSRSPTLSPTQRDRAARVDAVGGAGHRLLRRPSVCPP